ncbi:MAG: Hsp20/alpha crystallin family protein [Chloroflexi bacterium]|nr:Hsp20/alpha crystallin family protein [Chloroflexota bacterium]
MTVTRYDPTRDVLSLREVMDRLIEDSFIGPGALSTVTGSVSAPIDISETADAFHVCMDLPGMKPEDIDVNVTGDTVQITAERRGSKEEKKEGGFLRQERRSGRVQRSFVLPTAIDASKVDAEFRDGVLHVDLPKSEEMRPKSIKVRGGTTTAEVKR